ncbi:hypothetical protein B0T24DRAFT_215859 [Lasiosphaeria ovina]|uniref:Uncharacterized protein n=1 Tax=Lasiosphaeria ovina TaxID=92902 RepID=A0AAE0KHY6_9PEZI|nr:hypothetical protein B0T24DRAFT_215859 [Lasiosphaeria ovina]
MGLNIFERIQAKLELLRLEKRYTRRRNRRSTFVSNAIYVDGEYIYNSPNTTGSSSNTSRANNSPESAPPSPTQSPAPADTPSKAQKRLNRWSSMPGFGSNSKPSNVTSPRQAYDERQEDEWRTGRRNSFSDMR